MSEAAGTAGQAVPGLAHSNLSRETSTANVPFSRWGVHGCGFIEGLCGHAALAVSNTLPPSASVPAAACPEGSRLGAALLQTPVRAVGGAGVCLGAITSAKLSPPTRLPAVWCPNRNPGAPGKWLAFPRG
ncbi:55 kDa erythrocyte membrane protein [Platysternon megacephalum]|uniref:55 kDa erythrocyte membrane protein n=1 Tax=Platysternon megacephalum TaxID=55544 RepID=A0A4D9DNB3_9SAUR|nr:55 kDa erythrocyte membrane protein [Platysternon megacephalum]